MSRTIPGPFVAHLQGVAHTDAWAVEFTRSDGQVYRWTAHDRDATIASELYVAQQGVDVSSLVSSEGLAVDNLEATILPDADITKADILAGRWDGAQFQLIHYNTADPTQYYIRLIGRLGVLQPKQGAFVVELRDLRQTLQQDATWVLQPTCRWRLGDSRCTVALGPLTFAGSVDSVASARQFTDAGLVQAADYFAEGELTWSTGLNSGIECKVRDFGSGGIVTLEQALVYAITPGDTFSIIAGCRKRREDCKTKFGNILNFGGEPDKPTVDQLVSGSVPA
jgi:uncharacterized phage protein (TIGR02218 family)